VVEVDVEVDVEVVPVVLVVELVPVVLELDDVDAVDVELVPVVPMVDVVSFFGEDQVSCEVDEDEDSLCPPAQPGSGEPQCPPPLADFTPLALPDLALPDLALPK